MIFTNEYKYFNPSIHSINDIIKVLEKNKVKNMVTMIFVKQQ